MRGLFILLMLLCMQILNAQTRLIDSLRKQYYNATANDEKLNALLLICEEYQSLNRDSFDVYGPAVMELAEKSNNKNFKSLAMLAYANWYYRYGWSDSAIVFIEPELTKNKVTDANTRDIYFKLARAKAIYHGSKSRYEEALTVLYKILPEAEKYKDTFNIGLSSNTIGSIAIARQQYRDALQWIDKTISISENKQRFLPLLAPAYLNKGKIFELMGNTDSALYFINKGLLLSRQIQNLNYIATALRIRASIYTSTKKYREAEESLLEMMDVRKLLSPATDLVDDNVQLAEFYANSGQLEKAIALCKKNLVQGELTQTEGESASFTNDPKMRLEYLQLLSGYYKKAGMLPEYQASLEDLLVAKDALYAANSVDAIAALQTQYEVQKKENTILQQKYGLQKKNFLFYGSIGFTTLLLIGGIVFFRQYRKKQALKMQLMMEEEKRMGENAVRQAEEKERVRIAADLHDNIGAYASAIRADVEKITTDGATKNHKSLQNLEQHSKEIMNSLRDTIWVLNKENITITSMSDRLKDYISKLQPSYNHIQFHIQEDLTNDLRLNSQNALNIFRIMQEAIHNALRHSHSQHIYIDMISREQLLLKVTDDGKGISGPLANTGNGLLNMKSRAKEAGMHLSVLSTENKGTTVTLQSDNTN